MIEFFFGVGVTLAVEFLLAHAAVWLEAKAEAKKVIGTAQAIVEKPWFQRVENEIVTDAEKAFAQIKGRLSGTSPTVTPVPPAANSSPTPAT